MVITFFVTFYFPNFKFLAFQYFMKTNKFVIIYIVTTYSTKKVISVVINRTVKKKMAVSLTLLYLNINCYPRPPSHLQPLSPPPFRGLPRGIDNLCVFFSPSY